MLDGAGAASGPGLRPIEAPYLQLVLTRLWDEERRAGSRQLRLETLERLGGAERIVRTHLDDALDALSADEQELAASVFRYLVTPSGTKIAHRVDDLAEYAGAPPAAVASVLGKLAAGGTRVVRPAGEDAYEIYHDVLAGAVLDWRARYLHARELAARRGAASAAVAARLRGARPRGRGGRGRRDRDLARPGRAHGRREAAGAGAGAGARTRGSLHQGDLYRAPRADFRALPSHPTAAVLRAQANAATLRVWEWDTTSGVGKEVAVLHAGGEVLQATFNPGGDLLVTAGTNGQAIVWRWESAERLADLEEPFGFDGAVFDPRGRLVALPGDDGRIRLWNWRTGRVDPILDGQGGVVAQCRLQPRREPARLRKRRRQRAGMGPGQGARRSRSFRHTATPSPTRAFSPDGRFVATGGQDGRARVWDWRARRWSGRSERRLSVESVAFNPDGTILAVSGGDGIARLWDWRHNRRVAGSATAGIGAVAFSPNGCLVATASYDSTARVWAPPLDGCPR